MKPCETPVQVNGSSKGSIACAKLDIAGMLRPSNHKQKAATSQKKKYKN